MTNNKKKSPPKEASNKAPEVKSAKGIRVLATLLILTWIAIAAGPVYLYMFHQDKAQNILALINNPTAAKSSDQQYFQIIDDRLRDIEEKQKEINSAEIALPEALPTTIEPRKKEELQAEGANEPNQEKEAPKEQVANAGPNALEVENIQSELSEVANRTVELEAKLFSLSEVLKKADKEQEFSALVVSAVNLREAVRSHKSFTQELELLKQFQPKGIIAEEMLKMLPYAEEGSPSIREVKEAFSSAADAILDRARKTKEAPTFKDKIMGHLTDIVSIRKLPSDTEGQDIESVIARTEYALMRNDLEKAQKEIETLDRNKYPAITEWLEILQAHSISQKSSAAIYKHIINPEPEAEPEAEAQEESKQAS